MSLLSALSVVSFHRYNPDWRIVVCLPAKDYKDINTNILFPFHQIPYKGDDCFGLIKSLPYVEIQLLDTEKFEKRKIHSILISDIWRRENLYINGGVYSDFDVIWLKPMSHIINVDCIGNPNDFEGIVSFYELTHSFHNISNMVTEPGSIFLDSLIQESYRKSPPYGDQTFGADMLNALYPNWNSVVSRFPRMLAIPYETFYPYSTFNLKQLFSEDDLTPLKSKNVMCIHWFYGNSLSKEYLNENGLKRDCSMTSVLKKEGYI